MNMAVLKTHGNLDNTHSSLIALVQPVHQIVVLVSLPWYHGSCASHDK